MAIYICSVQIRADGTTGFTVMKDLQKNCDFQNFGKREGVEVTLNVMIC